MDPGETESDLKCRLTWKLFSTTAIPMTERHPPLEKRKAMDILLETPNHVVIIELHEAPSRNLEDELRRQPLPETDGRRGLGKRGKEKGREGGDGKGSKEERACCVCCHGIRELLHRGACHTFYKTMKMIYFTDCLHRLK